MKKLLILFISCCSALVTTAQHDNLYSQYMFNGLVINPAYAGATEALSLTLLHRNQWVGLEGAPTTNSFSAHMPLRNKKVNLGVSIVSDHFGLTKKNNLNAVYAYRIQMRSSAISFGLQGGVEMLRNNYTSAQTTIAGDQLFMADQRSATPRAGFGIYYNTKQFYAGISAPSLLRVSKTNEYSFSPAFFHAGYSVVINNNFRLQPSLLVKYINHSPVQFDINLISTYKDFSFGASYRTKDALVLILQFALNDQLSAGYSYDLTTTRLRNFNSGSHELMLRYNFGYKFNAKSPRHF